MLYFVNSLSKVVGTHCTAEALRAEFWRFESSATSVNTASFFQGRASHLRTLPRPPTALTRPRPQTTLLGLCPGLDRRAHQPPPVPFASSPPLRSNVPRSQVPPRRISRFSLALVRARPRLQSSPSPGSFRRASCPLELAAPTLYIIIATSKLEAASSLNGVQRTDAGPPPLLDVRALRRPPCDTLWRRDAP